MSEFVNMTSYSENEKHIRDNYDANKCYCGNKFVKFKVKEFNKICFLHDREYDAIDRVAHMLKEEYVNMTYEEIVDACRILKLLADRRFKLRMERESLDSFRLKILARIGYFMVRMLKDSYPINFKGINK